MIISITRSNRPTAGRIWRRGARHHAFTLPEVIIGATLSTIVLAGVMSAFLMLGRSGVNVANYSTSEAQIRRGMEEFGQDVRMASAIAWNSSTSVTLTVPGQYAAHGNLVTYAYDPATSGATARSFYRVPGAPSSGAERMIFVRNISSFSFARYNRLDGAANSNAETKRLQITMNVRRSGQTVVAANTSVVSASYILRNKVVR